MVSGTVCTICLQDSEEPFHVLPCGHQFHVSCAIQWFREGNSTCCNCRSRTLESRLQRRTPGQRIAILRRRKHISCATRQLLKRHDALRAKWLHHTAEMRAFRALHRDVIREHNRLRCRQMTSSRNWRASLRQLSALAGDAPFYGPRDSVDGASFVFGSDSEDSSSPIVVL